MLTFTHHETRHPLHENVKIFTASLILVTILNSMPASAALIFQYETTLDLDVGAAGRTLPVSVTCDPVSGEICVTDARQNALHVLNAANVQLMRTGPLAGVQWPSSGCIAPDGTLVYAENSQVEALGVRRLDIYGEPADLVLETPDGSWRPQLLMVLADGDLLSLDPADGRLTRHDGTTGALVWAVRVGDPAASDTRFGRPAQGPDGRIFVPGGDQRRVFVLADDGTDLGAFGRFGSAEGRMSLPVGVAFGPGGRVLVLDRLRGKVLVHSPELEFQSEFGSIGSRAGQFYHPADIASSADGRVYVAQGFLGRVQVFRVFDSKSEAAEKSVGSTAAINAERIALGGAEGDRAATRSRISGDAGSGSASPFAPSR
jgi:DNA-binding beta-propeller fold protein YncE